MAGILTRSFQAVCVRKDMGDASRPPVFTFRANDGQPDRLQDRNSVKGWQLENYRANPIVLFNHDDGSGGFLGLGKKDVLPIGKARAYVEGDALMADIEFDQDDDFAKKVQNKIAKGILNAVSVRYLMSEGKYRENELGGYDSDEQELLEISVVNIPGNQRAVRVKALEAEQVKSALIDQVAKRVVEMLDERQKSQANPNTFAKAFADAFTQRLKES